MTTKPLRRYPIGAETQPGGGVHFLVWAPDLRSVELVLESGPGAPAVLPLDSLPGGYFGGLAPQAAADTRYRFRLDGKGSYPDPASRYQPDGPHGSSQVVDPSSYQWGDGGWRGIGMKGQVIYEMHLGTFTREGTYAAAAKELEELAACGVTVLEVMPVADFPGRFGWGYDGVGLFAPVWLYGEPDDFRRFVDEAHRHGLGVILDVVYNHIGPSGNYLGEYSKHYFTDKYENEWGQAINFDGEHSRAVREFFITNARYWIEEFHLDGLRLDATQQIFDSSPEHVLAAMASQVRAAAKGRSLIFLAENETQVARMAMPVEQGGLGLDAVWNDDFHHCARVALTGNREAYFLDYLGKPQEFLSMLKHGFLYQGQRYKWQSKRRGTPSLKLSPEQFVVYIQNHDQVANSGTGERLHFLTSLRLYRTMTALLLLSPATPMLFQGQEFAASTPFHYFSDHNPELGKLVKEGRIQFMHQFRSLATPEMQPHFEDPGNPSVFERCKLDFTEREKHRPLYDMHKDLLRLRREDTVFSSQAGRGMDGAVLAEECLLLRLFGQGEDDRLLIVNFGKYLHLDVAAEPLLAPPEGMLWNILWSSENPKYGGIGTPPLDTDDNWKIPHQIAVALHPKEKGATG